MPDLDIFKRIIWYRADIKINFLPLKGEAQVGLRNLPFIPSLRRRGK